MKLFKYIKSLWPFIQKEEFFKIILSFVLLGVVGSIISSRFQSKTWERQVRYELLKDEISSNRLILQEIASIVNQRLFYSQQIFWAIKSGQSTIQIESLWNNYMGTVNQWNSTNFVFQSRLAEIFDYDIAGQFMDDEDDLNNEIPKSIHYKFYLIHQKLSSLKNCYYAGCGVKNSSELDALIKALIEQQSKFIPMLNEALLEQYNLLKISPISYVKNK